VQKPNFSVAEAFSAGIDLIERSFGSVLVWAATMFVLTLITALGAFLVMGGHLVLPDGGGDLAGMKHLESGLATELRPQSWSSRLVYALLGLAWLIVETAVIYAAIYRTALARKPGRMANLRLGATEAWLSLVIVVQIIMFAVLGVACWGGALVVLLVAQHFGPPAGRWVLGVGWGVVFGVALWLAIRLSLCQAMTVAEGRFRFFESWRLTSGRAWKLFWTMGLLTALLLGLEIFYVALMAEGIEIVFGVSASPLNLNATDLVPIPGLTVPVGLLWLAFVSFTGVLVRVLVLAPLASAYRGLATST
jgi:hypothetical protein